MFNSLRTRLTILFVGLTILPLVTVSTLIALRGFNTLQDQSVNLQDELAQRVAISLEAFFDARQAELLALTDIYGLDMLELVEQRNILSTLLVKQPAYYELALIDETDTEVIHVVRGEVISQDNLHNRADDPVYQQAIETRSVTFGEVYFNESARDRLVTIAIPIENLFTGEIDNVLLAGVRFQNIGEAVLRNLDIGADEDVYIANPNGIILAHRDPNLVIKETRFDLPASEGRTTGLNRSDVVLAMNTIQLANQEVIVVAETSYANAIALANDLTGIAAIITVITLIIAIVVVVAVVNRVVNPIIRIAKVATTVQEGDLSARAIEKGNDEIAILGRAFNQMTDELEHTLEGLQDNVEKLEASNQERQQLITDLTVAKRIADENSRLKSEFLATMSHELRTPLNAIEGFTSIMLSGMGVELNERAEDMVKRISSNSKRLLNLINDFLDLSRIEAGRLELVKSPLSPRHLAQKWEAEVSILGEEKGVEFILNISPNLPDTLLSDEDALSKIAINLLSNAFKFTSEGQVILDLQASDKEWTLTVSDTGIGIPFHAREYIFDEFRQVDGSSKRLYGGTGLGLSLVQKLSRAMGGNVNLDSEIGVGSTFIVTLPLEVPKESEQGAIA